MHVSNARPAPMFGVIELSAKLLINKDLVRKRDPRLRTKSVPAFHFGTVPKLNWEAVIFVILVCTLRPSSRTKVTRFSDSPRYRFSEADLAESVHAHLVLSPDASKNSGTWRHLFACMLPWRCARSFGRHSAAVANGDSWDLLLPLRGVSGSSWLREDVRNTKVCRAAMGDDVREAANQATHRKPRCRAA